MLKGDVFAEQLFENQIFALFINTFLDGNNGVASDYKNAMAITSSGGNISIASGAVCIQGRFLEEATSTTLAVGQTSKYHKLVIEIDLDKTNTAESFEQGYYKILTGNSSYPSVTQTDIVKNVSGIYQYELARFQTDSSGNVTNLQDKREFLDFDSIYTAIESATTTLLNTIEGNADTLISTLQAEIAGVEDTSEFIMKSQITTLTKNVTPTSSGGKYYATATFNLPSGWTFEHTCILKIEAIIDSGGVGDYSRLVINFSPTTREFTSTSLDITSAEVTDDTVALKITIIRI